MKVLLTGFDPFGGESINPAYEAVALVPDMIQTHDIIKLEIPTVFRKSIQVIESAIIEHQPDIVLAIGQAGGRMAIAVERVGINVDDGRIADNEGNQPIDEVIERDGKNAYFSNLPIKKMVEAIKAQNIPAVVSNSAGTYVCNHVLYGIMHLINTKYKDIRGGFIHVPFLPQQVVNGNMASMSLDLITRGIEIAIETAVSNYTDEKLVGGSIF
ncbi:MAG: pyroglutamyl-peptidase I [Clostridiales bacterium]|nr:pyroglutamyl-peptidase I [Clostridiales bacterium]